MTLLTAAQSAAIRIQSKKIASVYSSQTTFAMELADLANQVAQDIMEHYDWRLLTRLCEFTGDGTQEAFDLPVDYERMLVKGGVFRPDWYSWQYRPCPDLDTWRMLKNGAPTLNPGFWIMLEGKMQFYPAIDQDQKAQFYYISKNIVVSADGTNKPEFTTDSDSLRLPEELLTLGLVWRWMARKKLEYAQDKADFDERIEQIAGREKGSRILAVGKDMAMARWNIPGPFGARTW